MAYFRSIPQLRKMLELLSRDKRWLILINADPDAMASAMALKRIMIHRVQDVSIAKVNAVTRPDNLAMVRYTRLHMERWYPGILPHYDRFALVDSQPHHHPAFRDVPFSIIIDHHPLPETQAQADYVEIKPEYGATSTLLTEYLYNLDIRPAKLLATALQFGIKTDTASFERHFYDVDLRAYQYLARFADHVLLSRIARSEFHRRWLDLFAKACTNMYDIGSGQYVYVGDVDNPDILVILADFLMRVYEIRWAAVGGKYGDTVVIIFRGDGIARDVGSYASQLFSGIGSAGGHKSMARAEFPASTAGGEDMELFIWKRLRQPLRRPKAAREKGAEAQGAETQAKKGQGTEPPLPGDSATAAGAQKKGHGKP
ncbi:DHH family phosphoesterase [Desulfovibrio sp. OttesenSCG-928-A18]|nr:DHH family phosphoesterase [Desulfovibrio sp. OttesenSCG-928-A18]